MEASMTLATMSKGRLVGPARMVCRTVVSARAAGRVVMVMVMEMEMAMAIRASILDPGVEERTGAVERSASVGECRILYMHH